MENLQLIYAASITMLVKPYDKATTTYFDTFIDI